MRKILAAKPSITQLEINYVNDAVTTGWGEQCYNYINKFTASVKNYFGTKYAWPTSSCHGALHMVLMALGIGPGDEVIVPDTTWVGSVFPINWLGATPVFVDALPDTWCIDPEKIKEKITEKTKAIVVVHVYGNLCEMDEIIAIGKKYGLPVIEDAAEALGSEYKGKKAGTIADFGVFSFHGTKTITTGEGGVIISNRADFVDKITTIDTQGRLSSAKLFWVDEIGLKYKMSNIQAALGTAQFERVNELVEKKRKIFGWYRDAFVDLHDIKMNLEQEYTFNSYWMPTVVFGDSWDIDCDELIRSMNDNGIAVRPFFYPVSNFPMFDSVTENVVSYSINGRGFNLPSYYELCRDDIVYIKESLINKLEQIRGAQ